MKNTNDFGMSLFFSKGDAGTEFLRNINGIVDDDDDDDDPGSFGFRNSHFMGFVIQ